MNVGLMNKYVNIFFLTLIMFLFFYDTSIIYLPTLLSGRKISILLLAILVLKKKMYFKKDFKYILRKIYPIALITFFSIIVIIFNLYIRFNSLLVSNSQLFSNIYYFFFFFVGLILFYIIFDDDLYFSKIISYVHIIQSFFVYLALIFPAFRNFTANTLHQLGNIALNANYRIVGFTNTGGASVSLLLFSGMAVLGYLIINSENKKIYYFQYLFILIATFFVAKTGFYLGAMLFLFLLIYAIFSKQLAIQTILKYSILILVLLYLFIIILEFHGSNFWSI